jgi:glycosyltransferase involved in cell wall biosynthesis
MKISVITPVLNRAAHIERAVRSVTDQEYRDFEHIVIDGKSTDGTLNILSKYRHLHVVSESDEGCVFAVNKGIRLMTGDVFAWLNSDEIYLPGTFQKVRDYFQRNPSWDVIFGHYTFIDDHGREIGRCGRHRFSRRLQIAGMNWIAPSAAFVRSSALQAIGGQLDERWRDVFDHDLWIRLSEHHKIAVVPDYLSSFGLHPASGVVSAPHKAIRERVLVREYYGRGHAGLLAWVLGAYVDAFWWIYKNTKWRRMTSASTGGRQRT